jgi:hypothetical protein
MTPHSPNATLGRDVSPRVRGLFLKNLGDFQTELARIHAGFLPLFSVWRQRKDFPALIFRSLRRVQDLRQRGRELGLGFGDLHLSAAAPGRELLELLCHAPGPADLLQSGVVVVHSLLIAAIDDYLQRNDNVYDLPSAPLLEADRDELRAQVTWAEDALAELAAAGQRPAPAFTARVQALGAELAATLRDHNVRGVEPLRTSRRLGTLPPMDSVLPPGFQNLPFGPEPLPKQNVYADRERYHAVNFLQEVQAADSCATMLFEAPDMPWDFYLDLGRHMWDESRHAMFGERKLLALGTTAAAAGLSTKAYMMRQTLAPLDRYAALSTQEADAFPAKHEGLKDALAHQDTLSAMAWSYDIADETQHLRFGTKWLPVLLEKTGDPRSCEQLRNDACNWRLSVLAEVYKPVAASFQEK